MRVLFVLRGMPQTADHDGMARWVFNIVREMAELGHVMDAVGLSELAAEKTFLTGICREIHVFPLERHFCGNFKVLCGWDSAKIRSYDRALCRHLIEISHTKDYDLVFFCGHGTHAYLHWVKASKKIIAPLDANNGLVKITRRDPLSHIKKRVDGLLEKFSLRSYSEADCVLVVSEADRQLLKGVGVRNPIFVISIGVDSNEFRPREDKWDRVEKCILFTGALAFPPNVDAAEYLVRDIYQQHALKTKDIGCIIAGRRPSDDLKVLCDGAGVVLLGDVADLKPVFNRASVYVAPMRSGLGMKTKVLEAMAMGLPVVGTPLAFNGIKDPQGVVVCQNAAEFAEVILHLVSDTRQAREMGKKARSFVESRYSPRVLVEDMLRQVQGLDS